MFFPDKPAPPAPKHGNTRMVVRFAWKPTEVRGGIVWLERYRINQRYYESRGGGGWWTEIARYRFIPYEIT